MAGIKTLNNRRLHLIIITLVTFVVYSNTLPNKFNFDDPTILLNNPATHGLSLKNIKDVFTSLPNGVEYLPLRDLTYMIDYELLGLNPFGYHLSNIIYYLVTCIILYLFLSKLLFRWVSAFQIIAFLSTLLFAVHPVHVESVGGIAQRKDLISGLFFFLSLYCFLLYKDKGRVWFYVLSILSCGLSLLGKSTAIVLPIMILSLEFVYLREKTDNPLKRVFNLIPFFIISFIISTANFFIVKNAGIILPFTSSTIIERIPTALKAIFKYLRILAIPYPLSVRHEFQPSKDIFEILPILSLIGFLALLYLIIRWRQRSPLISLSLTWYLLSLLPVIGLIPTSTIIAERYLFLPSVGFCIVLSYVLFKGLYNRVNIFITVFVTLAILFSAISFERNFDWKNMKTLMKADLKKNPTSYILNLSLGKLFFENADYAEAMIYLTKAKEIKPRAMDYEFYLTYYLYKKKQYKEALSFLKGMRLNEAEIVDIHYLLGIIYEAMADYENAKASYLKALKSKISIGVFSKKSAEIALSALNEMGK